MLRPAGFFSRLRLPLRVLRGVLMYWLVAWNKLIRDDVCNAMSGDKSNNPNPDMNDDFGLAVQEARPRLKKPPLYRVLLLNDDYTPMEFVVEVLELIFTLDREQATRVMLEVHTKGKGICGVFTYEIAETKVAQVSSFAQQNQHPLLSTLEEA